MFRTSWKKVSYADRAASGRQQQARPPVTGRQGGGSQQQHSGGGPDYMERGQMTRDANIILQDERLSNSAREKFLFNQRIKMEEKRTKLAKGNILNFLMDRKSVEDKKVLLNKALRTVGFKCSDIFSIKLNDYRDSQAEVLLKDGVPWDLEEIEKKLKEAGLNINVSSFDEKEEVIMVFGLPLTNDISGMKEKIREAIEPFVARVKDILATVYNGPAGDEEDFFGGLYDGNYRVKVTPLKDGSVQVPNFVVIDQQKKVCAKALYSKAINEKKNMCTSCYATDHFRDNVLCKGPKTWEEYTLEFELAWRNALAKKSEELEAEETIENVPAEGRYEKMISDLKAALATQENKISELETEVGEYKRMAEPGENMSVNEDEDVNGGNNNQDDEGGSENSSVFVETEGSLDQGVVPSDAASGLGDGGSETSLGSTDPLDTDWAAEMEAEDNPEHPDNPNKRKVVTPLGGGVEKKNSKIEEIRRKFIDLNLQVGTVYDFWTEGQKRTGTCIKADFPFIEFKVQSASGKVVKSINFSHNGARVRLPTKHSI